MTCIYDYSYSYGFLHRVQITSYASDATGDVAPISRIEGERTGLSRAFLIYRGVAVGPDRKIYAYTCGKSTSYCTPTIEVYAPGASGAVKPIAAIAGPNTGLLAGDGYVAVDSQGTIYVVSSVELGSAVVTVYGAGASGNVAPIQTISGSYTGLNAPRGIAVDAAHNIYVSNDAPYGKHSVTVYAAGSTGNVAPIREITGKKTQFSPNYTFGIALDGAGNIYVANYGTVLVFAAGATGNVAPIGEIMGKHTRVSGATGVALDSSDNIYVNNTNYPLGPSYITVYQAGENGNHRPLQIIRGSATRLRGHYVTGIAVR